MSANSKSGKILRNLLIAAGAVVVLLVLAALIVPRMIPWDKVKLEAEQKISDTLHHRVTLGSIGFNLFTGIDIRNIRVENAKGFSAQPFLTDDAAIVQYRLLPLLWGKLMFKAIILRRPVVNLERNAAGTFNFSDMLSAAAESNTPPAAAEPANSKIPTRLPLALLVSKISIQQAALTFQDHKSAQTYAVKEFNLDITNLTLAGLAPVKVLLSAQIEALGQTIPVKLATDWRFQYARQRFLLDSLQATLPGVSFTAAGKVDQVMSDPTLDLSGAVDLDFARMQPLLAVAADKLPKDFRLGGTGRVKFKAQGPATDLQALQISLDDRIDAQATAKGLTVPVTLIGDLSLAKADLRLAQKLTVPGLRTELSTRIQDIMHSRQVTAKLSANLNLTEAMAKLVPPAQAKSLGDIKSSGKAFCNAEVNGPASDPKRMHLSARLGLEAVSVDYQGKSLLNGLTGTLSVLPDRVSLPALKGKLGGQPIKATLSAQGFDLRNPASLKPDALKAQVNWTLESTLLDVDALMALVPAAAAPSQAGVKAAEPAPATVSDLPEPDARALMPQGLSMHGSAALGGLKFGQVKLGKMDFKTDLQKRVLTESGTLLGYEGSIREQLRLDFTRKLLGYTVDGETKTVNLEPLMTDIVDTFLAAKLKKPELIAELKNKLTGRLNGKLQIKGLGMRTVNAMPNLTGHGNFVLTGGEIKEFSFQANLAKWFGSEKWSQPIPFDNTVIEFSLARKLVQVTKFVAESGAKGEGGDMRLVGDGNLTFGAEFDNFHLRPSISPRAATNLSPEFRQYAEVLKDDRGWVTIPMRLNGPMKRPDVQPDWDWIKQQFGGYAGKKAKAAAAEAGKKAQGFLESQKGKSTEEVKQNVNQEVEKAKENLKNLNFQNLFK